MKRRHRSIMQALGFMLGVQHGLALILWLERPAQTVELGPLERWDCPAGHRFPAMLELERRLVAAGVYDEPLPRAGAGVDLPNDARRSVSLSPPRESRG